MLSSLKKITVGQWIDILLFVIIGCAAIKATVRCDWEAGIAWGIIWLYFSAHRTSMR